MKRPGLLQLATALLTAGAAAAGNAQPVTDAEACLASAVAPTLVLGLCERALADPALPAASRATLLTRRGELWLRIGEAGLAEADFTAAIGRNPASANARRARALLRQGRGELAAAADDLTAAIALNPRRGDLLVLRAALHHQAGRNDDAGADLAEALSQDPEDAFAHLLRGVLSYRQGAFTAAAADFAASLKASPVPYPLASFWLALARAQAGGDAAAALAPYAWWWEDAGWPQALADAIAGGSDIAELETTIAAIEPAPRRAQASFFAAEWARLSNHPDAARRLLALAASGDGAALETIEARAQLTAAGG